MIASRVLIFLFIVSMIPIGAIQYLCHKTGVRLALWKKALSVLLFLFSFLPYASAALLLYNLDLIYLVWAQFLLVWLLFYGSLFLRQGNCSVVFAIIFGLILMIPATSFITVSNGHFSFFYDKSQLFYFFLGGNSSLGFLNVLYGVAWTVLPLVGVHYLMKPNTMK